MPMLDVVLGLPFRTAAGISLMTVVATSSFVSLDANSRRFVNPRLAVVLLTQTVLGASLGRLLLPILSDETSGRVFGVTALVVAVVMLHRLRRRNVILDPGVPVGVLGSRFADPDAGFAFAYVMNDLRFDLTGDPRSDGLVEATYRALR